MKKNYITFSSFYKKEGSIYLKMTKASMFKFARSIFTCCLLRWMSNHERITQDFYICTWKKWTMKTVFGTNL